MRQTILIPEAIHQTGLTYLLDNGYDVKHGTGKDEQTLIREVKDCAAILTRNAVISERVMRADEQLKVIAMHGVGVNLIDVDAATRLGIQVVNAKGSNQVAVAEFTIGLLIAVSRNILRYDQQLRQGNWNIRLMLGVDLEGMTLGIVGMGAIGTLVAQKAVTGLGMNVIAYKRNLADTVPMQGVRYTDSLDETLQNADYVSLHIPYTAQSKNMIGAHELALMKPTAYLINTARGEVVDAQALYEALRNKQIAGAALDVFPGERLDPADPLLTLDNVILTPHAAAFTDQSVERMSLYAAMGIHEVLSGQTPKRPVNTLRQAVLA